MNVDDLIERLRSEAEIADRPGQFYRLNAIADEFAAEIEALQAEIERLRAEVERLKSMTAVTMGVGSGDGSLFVHGDFDSIKAAQAIVLERDALRAEVERWKRINAEQVKLHVKAEIRAERLAEALETCLEMEERPKVIELAKAALAALSEENSND